jgi:DNA-binding GntR family transcriptional regulator
MAQVDTAVEMLRERLISGALMPGDRLGEAELAVELKMSRTPVREALRLLSAEGLVEIHANRGARVAEWSEDELDTVFEIRLRLEGLGARRAAEKATAEQADHLHEIATKIAFHARPGQQRNLEEIAKYNSQFHGEILDIAGSQALASAVAGVIFLSVLSKTQESFDDAAFERSNHHHFEIAAAIRAGQGAWAESTMRSHMLSARTSLLAANAKALVNETGGYHEQQHN